MKNSEKAIMESLLYGKLSQLDNDTKRVIADSFLSTSTKAKSSINGAPINLENVEVKETEEGMLTFKHADYKTRKYPIVDLATASQMIEMKQFSSTNSITGTKFVLVNGKPYGENLVILAKSANQI
jgi:hypothetical protein